MSGPHQVQRQNNKVNDLFYLLILFEYVLNDGLCYDDFVSYK